MRDLLHGLGDAGVQRADDAEDVLVADELGGVLLADGGLGLVVEGFELEGDAVDVFVLVGRFDGEVGGVLDAQAQRGEVAGEGGVEADDDGLVSPLSPLLLSSPREPHAESVRAPAVTAVVRMSKER